MIALGLSHKSKVLQFTISIGSILLISLVCYLLRGYMGYRAVAILLLFAVSLLAMLVNVYAVLTAALLSALIWDFFFIPPPFTFHVNSPDDVLMLIMYLVIALLSGFLTSRIRRYEKQVQIKEEKLKTLKLYSALLNSVSHEFRTPMTTIIGISESLIYNNEKISPQERLMMNQDVLQAANRLNRLVDNMLDMSRLEAGFLQLKYDWCDIHDLINSAVNRLEKELSQHHLTIEIQKDIPLVKLDRGLFEQAVVNILHNACVHTPTGTNIQIKASCLNDTLEVCIMDNGPGVPNVDPEKLIEKFYKAEMKKTGGLGLGLSIAHGFINAHQGKIIIKNTLPHGAAFQLIIPVEKTQIKVLNE